MPPPTLQRPSVTSFYLSTWIAKADPRGSLDNQPSLSDKIQVNECLCFGHWGCQHTFSKSLKVELGPAPVATQSRQMNPHPPTQTQGCIYTQLHTTHTYTHTHTYSHTVSHTYTRMHIHTAHTHTQSIHLHFTHTHTHSGKCETARQVWYVVVSQEEQRDLMSHSRRDVVSFGTMLSQA